MAARSDTRAYRYARSSLVKVREGDEEDNRAPIRQ
jgi:hypothetical protein